MIIAINIVWVAPEHIQVNTWVDDGCLDDDSTTVGCSSSSLSSKFTPTSPGGSDIPFKDENRIFLLSRENSFSNISNYLCLDPSALVIVELEDTLASADADVPCLRRFHTTAPRFIFDCLDYGCSILVFTWCSYQKETHKSLVELVTSKNQGINPFSLFGFRAKKKKEIKIAGSPYPAIFLDGILYCPKRLDRTPPDKDEILLTFFKKVQKRDNSYNFPSTLFFIDSCFLYCSQVLKTFSTTSWQYAPNKVLAFKFDGFRED